MDEDKAYASMRAFIDACTARELEQQECIKQEILATGIEPVVIDYSKDWNHGICETVNHRYHFMCGNEDKIDLALLWVRKHGLAARVVPVKTISEAGTERYYKKIIQIWAPNNVLSDAQLADVGMRICHAAMYRTPCRIMLYDEDYDTLLAEMKAAMIGVIK